MNAGRDNDDSRLIVALDYPRQEDALALVRALPPGCCRLKIGKELFCAAGPELVTQCRDAGFDVFLDLKFHDIPNTVAGACRAVGRLGAWMINVHASGGRHMLEAAREALAGLPAPPLLTAVTVLTSHDAPSLAEVGVTGGVEQQVERLATLALSAGLDGVVCSAREAARLRGRFGRQPVLVTPGIRPAGSSDDDQSRTVSPGAALAMGVDYLVIGRPITRAKDPVAALMAVQDEVNRTGENLRL